ncbi:hypothetical protein ACFDR9_001899 [Janthinobacterium sp. CG_23.3]|uniref:hypothetical protein n=1 Tax=unclassified Janthinobacterium TaxID=2610881 RepID=UPI002DFB40ED|nr:hypothetical protein [Janthinobacterium sp. CG_S6]
MSQALYGLVRLAKTEQMRDVKSNVGKAVACSSSRRETKAILRRMGLNGNARQGKFVFDKEDGASSE